MATISQRIPNLLGGVSQQPDSLKLPGQVRAAVNCVPDPTYGMLKRPGLKLINSLVGAVDDGRWFAIIRDQTERYVCQFAPDGTLRVWDAFTGDPKTVNPITAAAKDYAAGVSQANFEMLQINDYNFVLNRSKTVSLLSATSPVQVPKALLTLNLIGYDAKYTVKLDSTSVSYQTPTTGTLDVTVVVNALATAINAADSGVYNAVVASNNIIVSRDDGADFTISAEGGLSSNALVAYKGGVPNVSRLPSSCEEGLVLKVSNLESAAGDDYYVKFSVIGGGATGTGTWGETVEPGTQIYLDPDTMPHVIIRESDGSFTYRSLNEAEASGDDLYWVERRVGDEETNPFPTFTGSTITGMSFFRNRLVLLTGSNVICSQPGSYFNLFRLSAITATDGDAIDLSTGAVRPVDLKYAVGDQLGLLCFAENAQFMLTAEGDVFGPTSAQVKRFSNFTLNPNIMPVETGTSVIFVDNNQGFSQCTEMVVTSSDNRPQVADLSRTSPNFVPAALESVLASSSATMLSFLSANDRTRLPIFKFFNNAGERVLASWLEWRLPGPCYLQAVDHDLFMFVTKQDSGYCLSTCSPVADVEGTAINTRGVAYEYRLDLFNNNPLLEYDAVDDVTKVFFKGDSYDFSLAPVVVVDDSDTERGSIYANRVVNNTGAGWYVTVPGDRTGAENVVLGYEYEFKLEMPAFYRKQSYSDGRSQSDVINIPRVHRMVIQATDSGPYQATVKLLGRPDKTYTFEQTPANSYRADAAPLPELIDNVIPVYGKGTDAKVTLTSKTPFPLSFVAATWYGVFSDRGIRAV